MRVNSRPGESEGGITANIPSLQSSTCRAISPWRTANNNTKRNFPILTSDASSYHHRTRPPIFTTRVGENGCVIYSGGQGCMLPNSRWRSTETRKQTTSSTARKVFPFYLEQNTSEWCIPGRVNTGEWHAGCRRMDVDSILHWVLNGIHTTMYTEAETTDCKYSHI